MRDKKFLALAWLFLLATLPIPLYAASFPGTARVEIQDPTGGLSWNTGAAAQTVSCWVKLSVPSTKTLSENMTVLVDRTSGSEASSLGYLIQYNIYSGNIEFFARGSSGAYTNSLVSRPYLERWYHLAVVRENDVFSGYVDGLLVFTGGGSVGNSSNNNGVCIGGWGDGKYLYGEVQEVAIYQSALSQELVTEYMFKDQPPRTELKGYYKLGYSTNSADFYKNYAPAPPLNTTNGVVQGSGTINFEVVNQGGEQSAFDSRRNGGQYAIAPLAGSFSWDRTLFVRPVPGIPFEFRIAYASGNSFSETKLGGFDPSESASLSRGWRHSFDTRILPSQYFSPIAGLDVLGLMTWSGSIETWDLNASTGEYETRHKEYRGNLRLTGSRCEWTTPDRTVYSFQHPYSGSVVMRGRLRQIRDLNSNAVSLLWDETIGIITQIVDTVGGRYDFRYNAQYQLTNMVFGGWTNNFDYDASNRLAAIEKTGPIGYSNVNTRWRFTYNTSNLLEKIFDPMGFTNAVVTYDKYGRKIRVANALGQTVQFQYGTPTNFAVTQTDPANKQWISTYDRKQHLLSQRDPLGNTTSYSYDERGNRISQTEPLGWKTTYAYDDRSNLIAETNALGLVRRWIIHPFFNKPVEAIDQMNWTNRFVYDSAGNMVTNYDYLGVMSQRTYFSNGLVKTAIDGNGYTNLFTYSPDGFLATKTDPASCAWGFGNNELGWQLSVTNPLNEVVSFTYDLNGLQRTITDPLRTIAKNYDANGNLLSETDAKGAITRYSYDVAKQRTQMVDRATNAWEYTYTTRGAPWANRDPVGATFTNTYDDANRLISVRDPLGGVESTEYDANGNVVAVVDKSNRRFAKAYDRLNRVVAEIDPLGNAKSTTYDEVGRIKTVTSPKGFTSTHEYDGRGRLIRWIDGEGFPWDYAYDGNANITNITDARTNHYVMTYGPRNERTMEINQDGLAWHYVYDELLRLKQQTDPNGTIRNIEYDPGSRIDYIWFSTGRADNYSYNDASDNISSLDRSAPTPPTSCAFTYDSMDRVAVYTDPFSKQVKYNYDPAGRLASVTYPDTKVVTNRYDMLGRLTNQTDWGTRTLDYSWDKANRLLTRRYPNGLVQTNGYDNAGRLISLSYLRTSGNPLIALEYAFDRNGNKTSHLEQGTLNWNLPVRIDQNASYLASGRLIESSDLWNPSNAYVYAYDAAGNMTSAVSIAQSYAFTYDEDNRVLSVAWRTGAVTRTIQNRYDALGRRVSKKDNGVETRYVLDLSAKMERILCDLNASSQISNYYVHGPNLCYRVDAGGGLSVYLADAQANVVAVVDANTNLVTTYAYTPYGRLLGIEGNQTDPYRFVGSYGVMEDLPSIYFMRARYYSAVNGVFLSIDPVRNIGPTWVASAYAYANNNPLSYIDANGLLFSKAWSAVKSFFSKTASTVKQAFSSKSSGGTKSSSTSSSVTTTANNSSQRNGDGGGANSSFGGTSSSGGGKRSNGHKGSPAWDGVLSLLSKVVDSWTAVHDSAQEFIRSSLSVPEPERGLPSFGGMLWNEAVDVGVHTLGSTVPDGRVNVENVGGAIATVAEVNPVVTAGGTAIYYSGSKVVNQGVDIAKGIADPSWDAPYWSTPGLAFHPFSGIKQWWMEHAQW